MNQELWEKHLQQRITDLTRQVERLRRAVKYEHVRAETWKHRALLKHRRRAH